jgi:signal peptidase
MLMEKAALAKIAASCATFCVAFASLSLAQAEALPPFVSQRLPGGGGYSAGIEGPATDAAGGLYAQNFQRRGMIGRWRAGAKRSELYARLPKGGFGSGTRFDRDGHMYVAAYSNHNVYVFDSGGRTPQIYFHSDQFHQPNDLAIAKDGTLYASDPSFAHKDGQVWRIAKGTDGVVRGVIMSADRKMGVANGVDLSPDEKTLYVSESDRDELWGYSVDGDHLSSAKLLRKFQGSELDGLRVDVDGRIYLARQLAGVISVVSPEGELLREIPTLGKRPSNLTFGGPDGKTVFVTQVDGGFLEAFRVDRPGREPCIVAPSAECASSRH